MEVHHHPHVEKKNFKEYFFEFLMIFLAVTMGFIAENIREGVGDHAKEKEYIISMIEDAKTDTTDLNAALEINRERVLELDTLASLCFNYTIKNDSAIYMQYRLALVQPDIVDPTERTLSQLENSGGMRLITKKIAVDNIIAYNGIAKKIISEQNDYKNIQLKMIDAGFQLFNFQHYQKGASVDVQYFTEVERYDSANLLEHDKNILIGFGSRVVLFKGKISEYIYKLRQMNRDAINLISTLKKEYHLENE